MSVFHIRQDTKLNKGSNVTIEGIDLKSAETIAGVMAGKVEIHESVDGFIGIEEPFEQILNTQGFTAGKKLVGANRSQSFFLQNVKEGKGLLDLHDHREKFDVGFDMTIKAKYLNCLTDRSDK